MLVCNVSSVSSESGIEPTTSRPRSGHSAVLGQIGPKFEQGYSHKRLDEFEFQPFPPLTVELAAIECLKINI